MACYNSLMKKCWMQVRQRSALCLTKEAGEEDGRRLLRCAYQAHTSMRQRAHT